MYDDLIDHGSLEPDDHRVQALDHEVTHLRLALESRPEIDQAKGALMAVHGCDASTAFAMLVQESQSTNTKLHDVARALLARIQTP